MDDERDEGLKDRLSRQGEEALGRLAEELVANRVVNSALAGAFEARERAVAAQEAAMGVLGIPSAADIERLTRRLRSVSQRLEGIEDAVDRLDERFEALDQLGSSLERLVRDHRPDGTAALERRLDELKGDIAELRDALGPGEEPVPRAQERLTVTELSAPRAPKKAAPRSRRR